MEHFEMVEKLRQKANVSYEEAKAALENSDWDLLDALVYLESQGKINAHQGESYTTRKEEAPRQAEEPDVKGTLSRFFSFVAEVINKANRITIQVSRHGKETFTLPLSVLILLMLFMFWWVTPLAVIGLFFGSATASWAPGWRRREPRHGQGRGRRGKHQKRRQAA